MGGIGDAETVEVVRWHRERRLPSWTSPADGFVTIERRTRPHRGRWSDGPYLPGRLVDAEVLGNPMHIQKA